jgi:succinate dehydrogenase/fumarate reductase flavoprotein subunit
MVELSADYTADIIAVGFGAAGPCAAIEAHDAGAAVIVIEKQAQAEHCPSTRMSGGGFHNPRRSGDFEALKAYAKAMFSGDNLPGLLEGRQPDFADELAELWARHAPDNADFMRGLDPEFIAVDTAGPAFTDFPGAKASGYAVCRSSYTGSGERDFMGDNTKDMPKSKKQAGEAFFACLTTGLQTRNIPVHYATAARKLLVNEQGEVIGVEALREGRKVLYRARRAVVLACGGYEYNIRMRQAFLDGQPVEGWAFYGSPANTGDGIRMALKLGAALSYAASVAARVICAIPERRHGIRVGLNTASVGKPNEIVVDNRGRRYASERRITKDPSRYHFYKEALRFDTHQLSYPRIPSWMVFDDTLMQAGPLVRGGRAGYLGLEWSDDNKTALEHGWILRADSIAELAERIRAHPDNRREMDPVTLADTVRRFNAYCAAGRDIEFDREPDSLGPVAKAPFYAIPLYPGGPNTKGGLRTNGQCQVLDWDDQPIPRLFSAGEISSVFQFVYQGGGNLAECITFGRIAGRNAAALSPS